MRISSTAVRETQNVFLVDEQSNSYPPPPPPPPFEQGRGVVAA